MSTNRLRSVLTTVKTIEENLSNANTLTNNSLDSQEYFFAYGRLKTVNLSSGNDIVYEIVDSLFAEEKGQASVSSSACSVRSGFAHCEDMDKRLKQWHDTLRDRSRIQNKISLLTGRKPEQMLLNLPVSSDQHDKGNVLRLMDFATRMDPTAISAKQYGVLPAKKEKCVCVPEVRETAPKAVVEISGLANKTKAEVVGIKLSKLNSESTDKDSKKWINCKALEKSVARNAEKLVRVLEFYPDVNNLEVYGNNSMYLGPSQRVSQIELVHDNSFLTISSSTPQVTSASEELLVPANPEPKIINVGIKINDDVYIGNINYSITVHPKFHTCFECAPFDRLVKEVLRLENIGRKLIIMEWKIGNVVPHVSDLHSECFFFVRRRLKLFPGEVHKIRVMFQPRHAGVLKQRWILNIFPSIFNSCRNVVELVLSGKCSPVPEYMDKINRHLNIVTDKCKKQITTELTGQHAELVPLLHAPEVICPYERSFDERELFNSLNVGYHCERFDDIEALRSLYDSLKMPRESPWDLRLDSIKSLIMRLPEVADRQFNFQVLLDIQSPLCCSKETSLGVYDHDMERERTCFLFVKGCIGNGIEEWEEMMASLEESCFKIELTRFFAATERKAEENKLSEKQDKVELQLSEFEGKKLKPWLLQLKENHPVLYVLRRMRGLKHYRDSLYIHTYTQLCDMAENIVSIIESTRIV